MGAGIDGRRRSQASAVSYQAASVPPGTAGDYLDDVHAGDVVLDNQGRLDCTVWGGILTRLAARKGIAGTVVNGVARDTAVADDLGYPLFARGRRVLDAVLAIRPGEETVLERVTAGATLAQARAPAGYHELQRGNGHD